MTALVVQTQATGWPDAAVLLGLIALMGFFVWLVLRK